ncbi:tetratricopeptide repeat protein [Sporolactobacillus putidus]|uniref:Tetratricopeptide repeat protein n=1 Tax=Sporolactobacillus putidus TaxID=492735 RepID=A0A917W387_9BACL|nr:tetratricopeptide repeat protein [Sporolactobacillus putidus]GGL58566.1 hypothetical protein GCM10007968_23230 [Sporolactobacillus putidus]
MIAVLAILFFYIVLSSFLFTLLRKRAPVEKKGLYAYLLTISLICPPAGLPMAVMLILLQKRKNRAGWIDDYSKYVTFDPVNYEDLRTEAREDRELVPFSSGLNLDNPDLQKKLIVQLGSHGIANEGVLLRKAMNLNDTETVHYAATTINVLNDRYRKQVDETKRRFTDHYRLDDAEKLADLYFHYLLSGILLSGQEKDLIDECIHFLIHAVHLFPNAPAFQYRLGSLYLRTGDLDRAERRFLKLTESDPSKYYGYTGLLEIYYMNNRWAKFYTVVDQIARNVKFDRLPEKYRWMIRRLGGVKSETNI